MKLPLKHLLWYKISMKTTIKLLLSLLLIFSELTAKKTSNHFSLQTPTESKHEQQGHKNEKRFLGTIEMPFASENDFCIFYKGDKLACEYDKNSRLVQFSFIDNKDTQALFIVITQALSCSTEHSNTLQCLQLSKEREYICYKLQATRTLDKKNQPLLTWLATDYELPDRFIERDSLIFLFDPKLILGINIESWKPEHVFRLLPTIAINPYNIITKDMTTPQDLSHAMVVARLAALDIDSIHCKSSSDSLNSFN